MQMTVELSTLLEEKHPSWETFRALQRFGYVLERPKEAKEELETLLRELDGRRGNSLVLLKRGILLWLLGRREESKESLGASKEDFAKFLLANFAEEEGDFQKGVEILLGGGKSWYLRALLAKLYLHLCCLGEAERVLVELEEVRGEELEVLFLRGYYWERMGEYARALEFYRRVLERDSEHYETHFRLGYHYHLRGSEEEALEHYLVCKEARPAYVNALLNLGTLYEDREEYDKAIACYEAILRDYPDHWQAELYLEDCRFAKSMYYDEESRRKTDRRKQILKTPISNFELSVRPRNCLISMNIHTLGDLIQKTEEELLSYRNFGENSLQEIKSILRQYGLSLGEGRRGRKLSSGLVAKSFSKDSKLAAEDVLSMPVTAFGFSKRGVTCMTRLGIQTIGDLVSRSERELLKVRNFGQSSLRDIKEKLKEYGLSLKP